MPEGPVEGTADGPTLGKGMMVNEPRRCRTMPGVPGGDASAASSAGLTAPRDGAPPPGAVPPGALSVGGLAGVPGVSSASGSCSSGSVGGVF